MDWQTFIFSILGSGVVTAIVNGLMNHKTQIKMIQESGLYAKRVDVLDGLMKRMEELDRVMGELVSFFQTEVTNEDELRRRKSAGDAFNSFVEFYRENKHYLANNLSVEMEKLCKEYKDYLLVFRLKLGRLENVQIH